MHKHHMMPMSDEYLKKLRVQATDEWLATQVGQQYNAKYEQLWAELEKVCSEMDTHIHQHLANKYGLM